ncbi:MULTISPECIES: DNA-directed RNA polymerase subunit beta' [Mobiluncus]|uniref:DNA-directed RNA polymerase subunit beta' n=2 Tax=Mobiluncus TaxID=2050 RepID=E6M4T8_9ACTO|nr:MULTISPECIES: DNA-directed RNA polymerase subunit beta' [Mobiluncus]EFL93872.1 DNA-directed RNA polymerase, beta' subunit [Mobiluncus curtisii subsp. curtisii ATCC 35241]EFU81486.1 DNA-directed RNA polymerase, beta' subunit [Mobiluncus holmesii ATCC 35242]MCU9986419.1 DNA-directed RNA polymerase subunit beta' [Mobiluncus curtisii]MCV0000147.1 DNA-directed RNA polymerase subunit beta' [Mobiluncus curtisii]MCV0020143.1 DNA-directed RNA polymerase subunit beta' [Mobiluncus curtisii]
MLDANKFDKLHIGLATEDDINSWSHGEVKKPETINYRTLKPEKEGLFDERIFGPTRDWECACGKYKRVRYKGIVCERCGVEVTRSKVRRERMGHIKLAAPVTHIWYFKGVPSRLGYLLNIAPKDLEKVIYFAAYMITDVDEERRHKDLADMQKESDLARGQIEKNRDLDIEKRAQKMEQDMAALEKEGAEKSEIDKVKRNGEKEMRALRHQAESDLKLHDEVWDRFKSLKVGDLEGNELVYREMYALYGTYFKGGMGAQAVKDRLESFDLEAEAEALKEVVESKTGQQKTRALKRLKVINAFLQTGKPASAMVLDSIPVIPPDLRPMVQLDGGRFATSDLNDLYRRVINRNNRLSRLQELKAPDIIVNNEKRMLQEAVDALFDNGRRGRPVTGPGNRPLKSLSDMLKGKQGRFRQNLLGKRVDYSGRSVIVVGPQLKLHQCGLPKTMALELFKPFVMKVLVENGEAKNVKAAKRMVERQNAQVWDVLDEVITNHPVLLNRAPTLHRLGIQAFEPLLVEGKAIQLHPLVCGAFNADFDGDQMAVHVPLSAEAQAEARVLMLSSNNILKPSDGRPVTMPSQDMIIGIYHLTSEEDPEMVHAPRFDPDGNRVLKYYTSPAEARLAYDNGDLALQETCVIRMEPGDLPPEDMEMPEGWQPGERFELKTSLGRVIFNDSLPRDYPFVNYVVEKKKLGKIVNDLAELYKKADIEVSLDALKSFGFHWSTWSGITISFTDVVPPATKPAILEKYENLASDVQADYDLGAITEDERYSALIDLWRACTNEVAEEMRENFPERNNVYRMVKSGARGNWSQIQQIAGMRGLVSDPKQRLIERPIKSNYREGLSVLEYFIATHGARKGLADTALRTAESGYLTRRLVDVSQDVIIREEDCGTRKGLNITIGFVNEDGQIEPDELVETTAFARTLAVDAVDEAGNVVLEAGQDVGDVAIKKLLKAGITQIKVRSVLTCDAPVGTCAACYGRSLATGKRVDIGEAVGIIAAQSIGEPGTQLTMRTFHTGGAASAADITQGLPRVQELFEARTPKGEATITEAAGRVKINDDPSGPREVIITRDDGKEDLVIEVSRRQALLVSDGDHLEVGDRLTQGPIDPKKLLRVKGQAETQRSLVNEVQQVYHSQGVDIHAKHIEVIVRQMLRRVTVLESGDTMLLPGQLIDQAKFREENKRVVTQGKQPASARSELMGITKASLATDSWLSAASFQETTKVLTNAAMEGIDDPLSGLKENVILGKLIPAGTGLSRYRRVEIKPSAGGHEVLMSQLPYSDTTGFGLFDDDVDLEHPWG